MYLLFILKFWCKITKEVERLFSKNKQNTNKNMGDNIFYGVEQIALSTSPVLFGFIVKFVR